MNTQYINIKKCGTINELGDEYGLPLITGTWGGGTTSGVNSLTTNTNNNEILLFNNGGSVLIYNSDRTLNRTVLGFNATNVNGGGGYIRMNIDNTLYGAIKYVGGFNSTLRVMNTSGDTEQYTITTVGPTSFEFNPNNSNVFISQLVGTVREYDTAGSQIGSDILVPNVARIKLVKHQPNTNRIWVGGNNGNIAFNRLSFFDATTLTVTDVNPAPGAANNGRQIGEITGMSFYDSRIFIHHSSGRDSGLINSKMITEIDISGNTLNQWPIIGSSTNNYTDGVVYTAYTQTVIMFSRTDGQTIDVASSLILPN